VTAAESTIDFGDLLANDVPLEWHEAVAVMREVCAKLFGEKPIAPDPAHILLRPAGTIELFGAAPSGEPAMQRLAYTLSALLQGTSPPADLRIFASQIVSGTVDLTIDEFSNRLAYFERPGRSRVLHLLYARAAADLVAARARREMPVAAVHAAPIAPNAASAGWAKRARAWTPIAVAAVTIVITSALVVWMWPRLVRGYRHSPAATVVSTTHAAVGSLIASGVSSGRELFTRVGVLDAPRSPAPVEADVRPAATVRSPRPHRDDTEGGAPESTNPPSSPVVEPTTEAPGSPAPPAALEAPASAATAADVVASDATVYSAKDANVLPPELVWPQLSGSSRAGGAEAP
jgi:hypothetical protein